MNDIQQLLARGREADSHVVPALLSAPETERMCESLTEMSISQVALPEWFKQQTMIEQLNVQSHANAAAHAADFVCEYLLSCAKVSTLVQHLLVMEVWKGKLLPLLKEHLANEVDSVTSYGLIFHEANVANLLEMVLYDEAAFEVMSDDHMIELVDWCIRQMTYLASDAHADAQPVNLSCKVRGSLCNTLQVQVDDTCKSDRPCVGADG
jgi:zinc finger MYND domain-containing protein 10